MTERTLRIVVSGAGRIGWLFHLPEIKAHERFELVGVFDPLDERRKEVALEFGCESFSDYAAMLQKTQPDVVVVASPTHFHAEQAIAAMRAGIDVFCDKPIALDLAETDRMLTVMRETGRKMMVYQPHRALAETVALKAILARGLVGPVYMIKRAMSSYTRRNDWQAWKKYGGGMLRNYGAHAIDLLLYLAGGKVHRLHAATRAIATLGDADDVVKALFETGDGTLLDLDINMATAVSLPPLIVQGKTGSIMRDPESPAWLVRYYDPQQVPWPRADEDLAARNRRYMNAYASEIPWQEERVPFADFEPVSFYDKLYGYLVLDDAPFVPIEDTREIMRLIEACSEPE